MLSREWKSHGSPVFTTPGGALEDFRVVREGNRFAAYYCRGGSLQDQRLYRSEGPTPTGPWSNETQLTTRTHTRLYRGRIDAKRCLISAVWPGQPRTGIWLFTQEPYGDVKELLLPVKAGTMYCEAACNPAVYWDGEHYNVIFEGRNESVYWRLFHATIDPVAWNVTMDDDPLRDGANPSFLEWRDTVYLYYSKWVGHGFETHCMTQKRP